MIPIALSKSPIALAIDISSLPADQHQDYRWFSVEELLASEQVHQHTQDYFI